jgi:Cu(I)/Ag(I) efflux system membrane fusion protein
MNEHEHHDPREFTDDEGGLRPPEGLSFWRRAWWWFDFLILVKLARLRFVGVLLVIGLVITQWDSLIAYYNKWTRPASEAAAADGNVEWFCPMHPAIVRDNPTEKCPICFMPLSKRKKGEVAIEALPDGVLNRVQLSPYRVVLAGVQTWQVACLPLAKEINAVGTIEFNERSQMTVSARMNGRVDELLVNETGQLVDAGDVLASIYSPDLVVTMQNLLQAKKGNNSQLLSDARTRLELLGISGDQIDEIIQSGKANTHLKIRSPISGHVIRKYIRQGQYVQEGAPLYDVVDLASVWIQAQIYEDDIPFLPVEQSHPINLENGPDVIATTRAFPDEHFHGKLRFIYPHVDQQTRTLTVRFELDNPGHKLRPGSTANVKLRIAPQDVESLKRTAKEGEAAEQLAQGKVLAVPDGSVIDTGSQKIVYRESLKGTYEGIEVKLGPRMVDDEGVAFYPVLSGLVAGDRVVTSGSFLVDAETRLNPAAGSIYFGGSGSGGKTTTTVRATTPEDTEEKITAVLAKLSPADRKLAEAQRFCVVLNDSRLGSMGVPIKLSVEGHDVFICCSGCKGSALKNPAATVKRVDQLRERKSP